MDLDFFSTLVVVAVIIGKMMERWMFQGEKEQEKKVAHLNS